MTTSTIDQINIKNFHSIKNIKLSNLKNKKEIYIVGKNGDGKTLLLQAIAIALKGTKVDGLGSFRELEGYSLDIPNKKECQNSFFAYGTSRGNHCQIKEDREGYLTLFDGSYNLKSPKEWLSQLYSLELYYEKLGKKSSISVEAIKKEIITLLDRDVEIDITPKDVTFIEKGSEVSFEQLSAGYKGVIIIICDLIARLSEKQRVENIADFQGIVLIDEIELHLHPKWKYNFMKKLRDTFPLIQFIVTTHSPTVILGASKKAVFYKIYKDDGEVKISNQILNRGYTNNTLISSPLFDLDTMTSRHYDKRKLSEDDFVYELIHEVVSKKIKEDINLDEDAILKLIEKEFAKHEKN